MKNWLDVSFESSSVKTPEFLGFATELKNHIQNQTGQDFELADWNEGHFYISGFLKHRATGKVIYFSCSDVRFFKNEWHNNLLVRTAKDVKDYTGGSNQFCELAKLNETAKRLI